MKRLKKRLPIRRSHPSHHPIELQAELLKTKLELDRLRGILSRVGRVDQTRAATAAARSPGSFAELLERLDEHVLSCVIFTGDPIMPRFFTTESSAQNYRPEWLMAGTVFADTSDAWPP